MSLARVKLFAQFLSLSNSAVQLLGEWRAQPFLLHPFCSALPCAPIYLALHGLTVLNMIEETRLAQQAELEHAQQGQKLDSDPELMHDQENANFDSQMHMREGFRS